MELPGSIPIQTIKGTVPNYITARAAVAELVKREIIEADQQKRQPRNIVFCQYCGQQHRSIQALRAHLPHCRGRSTVQDALGKGINFQIGPVGFTVRSQSIKLLIFLERLEIQLNEWIAGGMDAEQCRTIFFSVLRGGQESSADGAITFTEHRPQPETISEPNTEQAAVGVG